MAHFTRLGGGDLPPFESLCQDGLMFLEALLALVFLNVKTRTQFHTHRHTCIAINGRCWNGSHLVSYYFIILAPTVVCSGMRTPPHPGFY